VVYAGHGICEPGLGHDDYRGLDVRGRAVLLFAGLPSGPEWQTEELQDRWNDEDTDNRYVARLELARDLGAAAVVAIERDDWGKKLEDGNEAMHRFFLPFDAAASATEGPALAVGSAAVAEALLGAEALAGSAMPAVPHGLLPGVTATISASGSERLLDSRNALGVIPGADPALRDELVMIGAHLDHLGRSGDVIFPGADDNASGSAALLEIAKAIAASPVRPKRTLAFAFWTGEEEGKFGSGHYVRHPVWPLERTTYLNLDMIGHPWLPEEIAKLVADTGLEQGGDLLTAMAPADFIELGLPAGLPELDAALRRAAIANGLALHFDRTNGKFGGSDYRDFARAGVPFIRFFGNFHPAYHEPGDAAEALDAEQVQRVARLALATAWLLADR
jgi:Zn-dependent M28 family amino/carboxypeptidase